MSYISKDFPSVAEIDNTPPSAEGLANFKCCERNSKGNPNALRTLGLQHLVGKVGYEKSIVLAFMYFKLAADVGNPVSQFDVGFFYKNGIGTESSLKSSRKYYQMAAENGITEINSEAIRILFNKDENDNDEKNQITETLNLKLKTPKFDAINNLPPSEDSLTNYQCCARNNVDSPNALRKIGLQYLEGKRLHEKSNVLAFMYFKLAADAGNPVSQFDIGYFYKYGIGTESNLKSSRKYYQMAAENGITGINSEAIRVLLKRDVKEIVEESKTAEVQKQKRRTPEMSLSTDSPFVALTRVSQFQKECLNDDSELKTEEPRTKKSNTGPKEQKNKVDYFKEILKLAREGDSEAQLKVGFMYINGDGTKPSPKSAFKYFLMGADNGNPLAQLSVANMYREGKIVEQSFSKAYKYYDWAFMQNNKEAIKQRDAMLGHLFPNYLEFQKQDTPLALRELAKIHQKIAGSYSSAAAFNLLHEAADGHNDAKAQYELANMYDANPLQKYQETADFYYNKAAEQGHKSSKLKLISKYGVYPAPSNAEAWTPFLEDLHNAE